jgi:hypothetical protein
MRVCLRFIVCDREGVFLHALFPNSIPTLHSPMLLRGIGTHFCLFWVHDKPVFSSQTQEQNEVENKKEGLLPLSCLICRNPFEIKQAKKKPGTGKSVQGTEVTGVRWSILAFRADKHLWR